MFANAVKLIVNIEARLFVGLGEHGVAFHYRDKAIASLFILLILLKLVCLLRFALAVRVGTPLLFKVFDSLLIEGPNKSLLFFLLDGSFFLLTL